LNSGTGRGQLKDAASDKKVIYGRFGQKMISQLKPRGNPVEATQIGQDGIIGIVLFRFGNPRTFSFLGLVFVPVVCCFGFDFGDGTTLGVVTSVALLLWWW